VYPKLELGAAFDRAMQTLVFDPLGMTETTFDYGRALNGNHAMPHHLDVDGKLSSGPIDMEYAFVPVRPAGGA
jgi:CubicO group peptidase (beta-lactamase class C family)